MLKFRIVEYIYRKYLHIKIYCQGQIFDQTNLMNSKIVINIGYEKRTIMIEDIFSFLII